MKFLAILLLLVGFALTAPHNGMVDTPDHSDVGILFTDSGFEGTKTLLIASKADKQCIPLVGPANIGLKVGSLQICKPGVCALYAGADCAGFSVKVQDHQNITDFRLPDHRETIFGSYACGSGVDAADATYEFNFFRGQCIEE